MITSTYVPLRVHSPYSLAEGAIFLDDLADRLKEWGVPAAGIADTNSISGAYSLAGALTKSGIQPLQAVQIKISHPGIAQAVWRIPR